MICFYSKNETSFNNNGFGVLDNYIINPIVTEELNGIFMFEFDYPIHAPYADELLQERIVKCPVPDMDAQLFRISEREATIGGLFHVIAYHIFYDLAQNLIEDTFIVNKNGNGAIQQILNSAQFTHSFSGNSNISSYNSARIVRLNIAEVLLDSDIENGFLSRYGGEIIRDNFHIAMQTVRGSDNGVCIRDKKNLTGYRANVDYSPIVTRIMPQGFDGLLLPEKYVDSPLIGNYVTPKIRVIKYDNVKAAVGKYANDNDAVPLNDAYSMLRVLAAKEYSQNHIDLPTATYDVTFAPLERTEEYRNFAVLETISLGDNVKVIHEEDGLNISARMVSYRYDPLVKAYISITLGSFTPKFTDVVKDIRRVENAASKAKDDANFALLSANGKNTNYYGSATPASPQKGDIWFKENGEKIEIWLYDTRENVTQWFPLSTDLTQEVIRQELEAAKSLVTEAKTKSEVAVEAGRTAQTTAGEARTEAQNAVTKANQAFDKATNAVVKIGVPYVVKRWEQGGLDSNGAEIASLLNVRSEYISVNAGDRYIAQYPDSSPLSADYHYYRASTYLDYVPAVFQFSEWYATGNYTFSSIIPDLNARNFESIAITENIYANSYTGKGDLLVVYRIPLGGRAVPKVIHWLGHKDTSDNAVYLLSGGVWSQIGMVTEGGSDIIHEWTLTENQRNGITSGNIYIAFFSIKQGAWAGIYNPLTPFTFNPQSVAEKLIEHLSSESPSEAATVPANAVKMRVCVDTDESPDTFKGNIYSGTERGIYTDTIYSAMLQQSDLINMRVAKNDIINQINLSTEGILISGGKIHITGQTNIDNAVISTAMIADSAITNAKIANLDAGKINTGTLSADRIAAGSITSAKLTIADGFITNAMIADSTIQNAKIGTVDAGKITTGTLAAARIAANSITAEKVATNFLQTLTGTSSIRITGTTISYYNSDALLTQINANGVEFTRDSVKIGRIGTNNFAADATWRGLVFDLEYSGRYMAWSWKETSSATVYTVKFAYYRTKLQNGMEQGFHFSDPVYFKDGLCAANGSNTVKVQVHLWALEVSNCYAIRTENGKAGFAMGSSNLVLGSQGTWCDFNAIRSVCAILAGKTLYLPASINTSTGALQTWYNVTFPSLNGFTT